MREFTLELHSQLLIRLINETRGPHVCIYIYIYIWNICVCVCVSLRAPKSHTFESREKVQYNCRRPIEHMCCICIFMYVVRCQVK